MNRKKIIRISVLVLFLVLSAVLTFMAYRMYKNNGMESLEKFVSSVGVWGVAIMLLLQLLQVVFAVIPGEPMELVMGALYGTLGGAALSILGALLGSVIIFVLVSFFGKGYIESFIDSDRFDKLKFLKDPTKRDVLVFILMFIPGTPKDLLTYFAPLTGIGLVKFLVISTVARIPSVISSTYVGSKFAQGSYLRSAVVFAVVGAVSLVGIYVYNKIVDKKNKSETKSDADK